MQALLNIEVVTPHCNLKALRHLHDVVEAQRGLRALGVPAVSYGSLLAPVILSKLPPELRLIVSREVREDRWQLDELMQVIDADNNSGKPNNGSYPIRGSTRNIPISATLLSNDSPTPKCSYC